MRRANFAGTKFGSGKTLLRQGFSGQARASENYQKSASGFSLKKFGFCSRPAAQKR
jgi:hypothetical protein